jgi:hypothetical protein
MRKSLFIMMAFVVGTALSYDPLFYENLTEVLPSTGTTGDICLGYFSSGGYWSTDTTGESTYYELDSGISSLRMLAIGRYGLTNSHTLSAVLPAYVLLSAPGDSSGGGIPNLWVSLDGWLERDPQVLVRGAARIPFKGALESGDYREGEQNFALEGAATVETRISQAYGGASLRGTGGLRYSFWSWDAIPGSPRDSADVRPAVEIRLQGLLAFQANPELEIRGGLEFATRGETDIRVEGDESELENSGRQTLDLRAGFSLDRSDLPLSFDLYYRLSGENALKEWGLMFSGIGLGFSDLFGGATSGGRS